MRVAVVGHIEWIEFARVPRMPASGEIVHATETWEQPGGGGAVAAVQLARLAGECLFLTALGDDELGHRSQRALEELGVRVEAAWRPRSTRRGFVHVDAEAERTITVIGERLAPHGDDPLPWEELAGFDAVYLTAGDAAAVRSARSADTLVATPRTGDVLREAGVRLDALVASAGDPGESYEPGDIDPPPGLVALTSGAEGGTLVLPDGGEVAWSPEPLPGPPSDSYGAGDSFAAGFTFGLGEGREPDEAAALGARCGAEAMCRRGV